ncbi:MAG: toll/interleukin-1 receptor domain-containing protein [Desulfobacterales bacterium]|jgi:flagellar basal body-associated protein FliL
MINLDEQEATGSWTAPVGVPKVFISYSREDALDFVEQLASAIEAAGFHPIVDLHNISGGEEWKERIAGLIAESDSTIFVITRGSVASKICEWEIDKTRLLGKRLIPVVPKDIEGGLLPQSLQDLHYVFFYPNESFPGAGFGKGLASLCQSLRTDLNWVRVHTRYGQRAAEWLAGNRPSNRLLSGSDIDDAKKWMAKREPKAPEITDEIREFISASEQAEIRRNTAEQKRIKEREANLATMEAALAERNLAQEQRTRAQKRTIYILIASSVAILALAAFGVWTLVLANRSEARAKGFYNLLSWNNAYEEKNVDFADQLVGEFTQDEKLAMVAVCTDAIEITQSIANSKDSEIRESDKKTFFKLYWGALYVVEKYHEHKSGQASPVESNMVTFGRILNGEKQGNLKDAASHVKEACVDFEEWLFSSLSRSESSE